MTLKPPLCSGLLWTNLWVLKAWVSYWPEQCGERAAGPAGKLGLKTEARGVWAMLARRHPPYVASLEAFFLSPQAPQAAPRPAGHRWHPRGTLSWREKRRRAWTNWIYSVHDSSHIVSHAYSDDCEEGRKEGGRAGGRKRERERENSALNSLMRKLRLPTPHYLTKLQHFHYSELLLFLHP